MLAENQQKNNIIQQVVGATALSGVHWTVSNATGAMTIKATAIPAATLTNLQTQYPSTTFTVDATVPHQDVSGSIVA